MSNRFLIVFDYDGVIVDTLERNLLVAQQAGQDLGLTIFPTKNDIEELDNVSFEDLGRKSQVPEYQIEAFTGLIFRKLAQSADSITIFDGIPEILLELSLQNTLIIITHNTQSVVEALLAKHGLVQFFDRIIGTEWAGSKHEKIIKACSEMGFEKEFVYMVGDTVSDIREAKLAGIHSIAVTWGFQSSNRLIEWYPDCLVQNPEEILRFLNSKRYM